MNIQNVEFDSYFSNVKEAPYDFANPVSSQPTYSPSVGGGQEQVFQLGTGEQSINMDFTGLWIGSARFLTAPFRVAIDGKTRIRAYTDDGFPILDGTGLESTFNFDNADITKTDDQTITGTTWVDVIGLSHELLGVSRPVHALLLADLSGYHDDADGRLEFRFLVNNVQSGAIFCLNQVADPTAVQTITGVELTLLKAGDNQIIVQARSSTANSGYVKGSVIPCFCHRILLGR